MKFEIERGSFGYIKRKKTRLIVTMLLLILAAVVIFVTGLLLNKYDKANICTVLSVLFVLPLAKTLVIYIVMFPYKGVSEELYKKTLSIVNDNAILMTDMVITSPDKAMHLDFIVITDNQVIGITGKKKQDLRYITGYLQSSFRKNKIEGFTVKITDDYKQFEKYLPDRDFEKTAKQDECFRYIRTLVV